MWQRFTEEARNAVFYAQGEVQKHGNVSLQTEHLLLGLLTDRQVAATKVLEHLGVSPDSVIDALQKLIRSENIKSCQDMSLSPRCKRVIDLSFDAAKELGHHYIGTEHLLWGLVREGDGLAGRTLEKLGVKKEAVMQAIKELQSG